MFLEGTGTGEEEKIASGKSVLESSGEAFTSFKNYVADVTNVKGVYENVEKVMIGMQDSSLALQRNMGGVVSGVANFRERLIGAYSETVAIGATFEDATNAVKGIADGMGKVVNPSKETVVSMVELSKATQMSTS